MTGNAIVLGMLGAVGLGLIAGGGYFRWQTEKFLRTAISADGLVTTIIKREYHGKYAPLTGYYPRVSFRTKEGRSVIFIPTAASGPSDYRRNQTVPIVYDPRQPQHAYVRSNRDLFGPSTFAFGVGILFLLPGIGYAVWRPVRGPVRKLANARRDQRTAAKTAAEHAWLLQNGRRIQAHHPRVELNGSVRIDGNHPYRITCEWRDPATNQMRSFCSGDIPYDPTGMVSINQIDVLIDSNNPDHYMVDTSFLPQKR